MQPSREDQDIDADPLLFLTVPSPTVRMPTR
jgi:hypothetical protein